MDTGMDMDIDTHTYTYMHICTEQYIYTETLRIILIQSQKQYFLFWKVSIVKKANIPTVSEKDMLNNQQSANWDRGRWNELPVITEEVFGNRETGLRSLQFQ